MTTSVLAWDGLTAKDLERLAGSPVVHLHDVVTSTLDLAHELGERGAPHGTLVLAESQTEGRGRQGRAWASPPGGLWLAALVRPEAAPSGGAMGIRAGLAMRDAVAAAAPESAPRLKWPNDLVVDGKKAGGVLCEASWPAGKLAWIAIGIGINMKGPVPREVASRAIALEDVAPSASRAAILAALVPRLMATARRPPELSAEERGAFLKHVWMPPGEPAAEDVAPDGALLLRRSDGLIERRTAPA